MSILIDKETRLVIQGITGTEGSFHCEQMLKYGTQVVAGVTPGKGGQQVHGVPVFNSVEEAVAKAGANASCVYVPAAFAPDAALEAMDAGLKLVVIITEGIPTLEMMKVYWESRRRGVVVIGPNCPGVISPGKSKIGIMPGHIHKQGNVGVVSRSGTLTYEIVNELTRADMGQSTCIGIGGDPVQGSSFIDVLKLFREDPETKAVVLIGEIGGRDEEDAAQYITAEFGKPVVGFIAGLTAPPGKRMGHAGAIITGGTGTAQDKIKALEKVGIPVARRPDEITPLLRKALKN